MTGKSSCFLRTPAFQWLEGFWPVLTPLSWLSLWLLARGVLLSPRSLSRIQKVQLKVPGWGISGDFNSSNIPFVPGKLSGHFLGIPGSLANIPHSREYSRPFASLSDHAVGSVSPWRDLLTVQSVSGWRPAAAHELTNSLAAASENRPLPNNQILAVLLFFTVERGKYTVQCAYGMAQQYLIQSM